MMDPCMLLSVIKKSCMYAVLTSGAIHAYVPTAVVWRWVYSKCRAEPRSQICTTFMKAPFTIKCTYESKPCSLTIFYQYYHLIWNIIRQFFLFGITTIQFIHMKWKWDYLVHVVLTFAVSVDVRTTAWDRVWSSQDTFSRMFSNHASCLQSFRKLMCEYRCLW